MKKENETIELGIIPEIEASGVSKISLVEEPAIQLDFLYFKKEEFVEPKAGESEEDFIPRCIAYNINEGKDEDQAAAICYSVWENKFEEACPPATLDIALNLENRQHAIDIANYGPLDPNLPNEDYWQEKADRFGTTADEAKKALCRNCAFFVVTPQMKQCIATGIDDTDAMDTIEAGELGYCEAFDFKCAASRTCDAWVVGGPIELSRNKQELEEFDIDTSALPQYVDEIGKGKKLRKDEVETPAPTWEFSDEFLIALEAIGSELGIEAKNVSIVDEWKGKEKFAKEEFLWKYETSGVSSNSRSFCKTMMSLNRYYNREEIALMDSLNSEFAPGGSGSYSIFKYKGGANCQHYWAKYSLKESNDGRVTVVPVPIDSRAIERQANTAIRTEKGRGFLKSPQNSLSGLSGHSAFSADTSVLKFADEEKKIIVGCAMIPNMEIPRITDKGVRYKVTFSEETIAEIQKKFMKEARTNEVNQDHKELYADTYVYESWLVEDPKTDKANTVYGFNVPKGAWMVKMQVEDPNVWRRVKNGELKGLSVEGNFSDLEEIESMKRYYKIKKILSNG